MSHAESNSGQLNVIAADHAIVIGASIGGLLAARVLSDHFDRVTIIERDHLPVSAQPRTGVPQSRHVHALMAQGRQIMERFFPGLSEELIEAGSLVLDVGSDVKWLTPGGWGLNFSSGMLMLSFSRDLLDATLRRRVKQIPNVGFLEGCAVTGLLRDSSGSGIAGASISIVHPGSSEREERTMHARVVLDASGRGSRLPEWLGNLGYQRPAETVINAHLGYASRLYNPPADFSAPWKALYIQAAPPEHTRGGLIFPLEGGRWMVTLGGGDRDYPPTDEAGFLDFARSLRSPLLYDAIKHAEPITPIYGTRTTENRVRHYDRLTRWPERLFVMGDGFCAFNPVYGQGMTTAALSALSLDRCLRASRYRAHNGDLAGVARALFKSITRINRGPWMLATGEDYRYRSTEGGNVTRMTKFIHSYMDHVFRLTTKNRRVRRRFLEVQQMLKTPRSLFRPGVLSRVAIQALFYRKNPVKAMAGFRSDQPLKVSVK